MFYQFSICRDSYEGEVRRQEEGLSEGSEEEDAMGGDGEEEGGGGEWGGGEDRDKFYS